MTNEYELDQHLRQHEYLRQQLAEKFPDADEETLRDTLEGMTDLTDMLAELIRSSLDDKAFVTALKQREDDMKERRERFETRAQKKRNLVWLTMERANLKKIEAPDLSVGLQKSKPSVRITDEGMIPNQFWIPQPHKLDRNKIAEALKTGADIAGVMFSNAPPTLSVRTK